MPVMTGLLPMSFLPKEKRTVPWIILTGYLLSFVIFEVLGIPVLLFTTYGDFALLSGLFTAADLIVIALGVTGCVRTGGIRLPYMVQAHLEIRHLQRRAKESGKKYAESVSAGAASSGGAAAAKGRKARRGEDTPGKAAAKAAFDPDAVLFWIIFALLLCFEIYMSWTKASIDGDDAYYVAQSVQTWQTGTMYYYVPYTGWTTTLDGRHALTMMPIWVAYIATACGTHPTIVAHSLLPMILIPLADLCLYAAAAELVSGFPQEKQRSMLPAIMILVALMQIFGNISIYTPETFLITRTWQGKSMLANFILPMALVLLLHWCGVNAKGRTDRSLRRRLRGRRQAGGDVIASAARAGAETAPAQAASSAGKGAGEEPAGGIEEARIPGKTGKRRETLFFWMTVVCLNLASGFTTSLAPAILTVLLLGAAFLIAVFLRRWKFFGGMILACIPNYLYLMLLMRTINSQWFSFLKGGRLP